MSIMFSCSWLNNISDLPQKFAGSMFDVQMANLPDGNLLVFSVSSMLLQLRHIGFSLRSSSALYITNQPCTLCPYPFNSVLLRAWAALYII